MNLEIDRRDRPTACWAEVVLAFNDEVVACERRFADQCTRLVAMSAEGQDTAQDEMLLGGYLTALTMTRKCRDQLLDDAGTIP